MDNFFGIRLKEYRNELSKRRGSKVGQVQLSLELGCSKALIGNVESGKRPPSKSLLLKLSKHSNYSLAYWAEGLHDYEPPNTLDVVLDAFISQGMINSPDDVEDPEILKIIIKAVRLEIGRKLDKNEW